MRYVWQTFSCGYRNELWEVWSIETSYHVLLNVWSHKVLADLICSHCRWYGTPKTSCKCFYSWRSQKMLTLEMKLEIIKRLEIGEGASPLDCSYNVNKLSIQSVMNNTDKIKSSVNQSSSLSAFHQVAHFTWCDAASTVPTDDPTHSLFTPTCSAQHSLYIICLHWKLQPVLLCITRVLYQ